MKVKRKVAITLTESNIKEMIFNLLDRTDICDISLKLTMPDPRSDEQKEQKLASSA